MLGKIVMTLLAFSSAALAKQQQCQLECTLVKQSGEARVTKSCYALDAEQCALVAEENAKSVMTILPSIATSLRKKIQQMAVHIWPSKSKQASIQFLDRPGRREAAGRAFSEKAARLVILVCGNIIQSSAR